MTTPTEQGGDTTPALELSPEEQASVAKAREGLSEVNPNAMPETGPQRPEYIPEKFWDAEKGEVNIENLAKSYGELEKSRSAPKEEPAAAEGEAEDASKDGKITKPKAEEGEGEENPLTALMSKMQTEYGEAGSVTDETIEALSKAGIPPEIVQTYLKGVEMISQSTVSEIQGYVNGSENYQAMSKWAAEALSDAELDSFNNALDNAELRETAVRGLYARYQAANPSEGALRAPNGPSAPAGDVYQNKDELLADQRNPKYHTDAAFRNQVMEKLARSQRTGFQLNDTGRFARTIVSR